MPLKPGTVSYWCVDEGILLTGRLALGAEPESPVDEGNLLTGRLALGALGQTMSWVPSHGGPRP